MILVSITKIMIRVLILNEIGVRLTTKHIYVSNKNINIKEQLKTDVLK